MKTSKKLLVIKLIIKDLIYDVYFGIKSSSTKKYNQKQFKSINKDNIHYEPLFYSDLFTVFKKISINSGDTIIDLGCGTGRMALMFAMFYKPNRIIGIDFIKELIDAANKNRDKVRRKLNCNVDFYVSDVTKFQFDKITMFLMFNPFGTKTFEEVIDKIKKSTIRYPRKIKIIYWNYIHVIDLFKSYDCKKQYPRIKSNRFTYSRLC